VQSEKVIKPPLTRADSVGVNSRAPPRISTLFWSFMFFSFHHLGPCAALRFQEKFIGGRATGEKCGSPMRGDPP
jgi:hypothetical protein